METFLLKYYSVSLFFQCMMGVIGIVVLVYYLILLLRELNLTWREKKAKQKEGCQQQEKTYMAAGAACASLSERASRIYAQSYRGRTFL